MSGWRPWHDKAIRDAQLEPSRHRRRPADEPRERSDNPDPEQVVAEIEAARSSV